MGKHDNNHVVINDMSFTYDNRVIFDNLNLEFPRGKITAIMGPSGAGKTTLLRLIGGELVPDHGQIKINGLNIHRISRRRLYRIRRHMGLLFQSSALFTNLNVYENVAFPFREHTQFPERLIRTLVLLKLQIVGLRGARNLMPSKLSGGMARRVALARAIALDPKLIMYDEPFTGLDPISLGVIVKLIHEINHTLGMTTIIVSHDVAEVASIADYIYLISNGKVIGKGTPQELQGDEAPAVKQFIRGLPDGVVPFHYPARNYHEDLFADD
jgi:phospholipid/cholesterol/gamma-HCH transport system ATP-binding protein